MHRCRKDTELGRLADQINAVQRREFPEQQPQLRQALLL